MIKWLKKFFNKKKIQKPLKVGSGKITNNEGIRFI